MGQEIDFIRDWAGKAFKIKALVSHLWLMGSAAKSEFGFVVLVTDVMEEKQSILSLSRSKPTSGSLAAKWVLQLQLSLQL